VITPHEEKCLRAAARAHVDTGLALSTHTTHGTMALEQLQNLGEEGADLQRVLIGHMGTHPDFDYVRRVVDSGVHIAFDTVGKQYWDFRVGPLRTRMPEGELTKDAYFRADATRAERIAPLVAEDTRTGSCLLRTSPGQRSTSTPTRMGSGATPTCPAHSQRCSATTASRRGSWTRRCAPTL